MNVEGELREIYKFLCWKPDYKILVKLVPQFSIKHRGYYWWDDAGHHVTVRITRHSINMRETLCHEVIHAMQSERGDSMKWDGDYASDPSEIEARALALYYVTKPDWQETRRHHCGFLLLGGDKYCSRCGEKL